MRCGRHTAPNADQKNSRAARAAKRNTQQVTFAADDVIINGNVIGCVRGLKVRLTNKARVQGDIIHKAIAIESGAHFEGTVQRSDNPFENVQDKKK